MNVGEAECLDTGTGSLGADGDEDIAGEGEVFFGDISSDVCNEVWGVAGGSVAVVGN